MIAGATESGVSGAGDLPPVSYAKLAGVSPLEISDDWIEKPIIERFDEIAARHEDKIAVDDGERRFSYGQLRAMSSTLAARLDALLPAGAAVGALVPNCALSPIALLACLRTNRPYVPIDHNHPAARQEQLIREANLQAVIGLGGGHGSPARSLSLHVLDVSSASAATVGPTPAPPQPCPPAVILFTSGSTGTPKGVCHHQHGILYRVAHATSSYGLRAGDRVLLLSSPSTIVGVRETLASLLNGATLHIADVQKLGLRATLEALAPARVTVGYIAPVLLRSLLALPEAGEAFSAFRMLRIGGDFIFNSDLSKCRAVLPNSCEIFITLTSTESPAVFQWTVPRDWATEDPRLPVGYPRPDLKFMISDENGTPVAEGDVGELVVSSRYLALGYWSAGQLQHGPFVAEAGNPECRTFHTGDLVRMRQDRLVELIGRRDRQVKISGFRADTGEVEAVLRRCANVVDAAVIARKKDEEITGLIAFVVGRDRDDVSLLQMLRSAVCEELPAHMRPAQIHLVDSIPHLPNFKVDVQALEELERKECRKERTVEQRAMLGPAMPSAATDASQIRAAVEHAWTALLNRRSFKADTPWDQAGGDSLGALHLWVEIENELGSRLPLEALSPHLAPSEIVAVLEKRLAASRDPAAHQISTQRRTVFFMPPAEGDAPVFARFRANFHDSIRFIVIDYPPLDKMLSQGAKFDLIIDAAVMQVLTQAASNEDCYFVGYSFGGFVAWGTARRMLALNRRVAFVGLLDSQLVPATGGIVSRATRLVGRNWLKPYGVLRRVLDRGFSYAVRTAPATVARLARLLPAKASFILKFRLVVELRVQARRKWKPSPLPVPTWLFRSDQFSTAAPDHHWSAVAARLKIVPIGGSHLSMLEPPFSAILCNEFLEAVRMAASCC